MGESFSHSVSRRTIYPTQETGTQNLMNLIGESDFGYLGTVNNESGAKAIRPRLCYHNHINHQQVSPLLLPPLHAKNLHHANKNIQKVQLQTNTLIDNILPDHPPLSHASMLQDLLHVVQGEASKDSETTIQPNLLTPHQRAGGGGREHKRCKAGDGHDGDTGQKGTTEVEVFFLFGGGADESDGTHHAERVDTGAGEDGR
jgi:hypothetical protein